MDQPVHFYTPSKPIDCKKEPAPREGLTVVSHNCIDLSVWEPQLLVGFYPSQRTRSVIMCNWDSIKRAARGLTLWNACLADFLLEYPETVQYYRSQYNGKTFVFAGTEYKQVGYGMEDGRIVKRSGRRALRGLRIGPSSSWEEVVVATANPFVREVHVLAVVP